MRRSQWYVDPREECAGRGNSTCQGPEAGASQVPWNTEETAGSAVRGTRKRLVQDEVQR